MLLSDYDTLKNVKNGLLSLDLGRFIFYHMERIRRSLRPQQGNIEVVLKEFLCQMSVCNEITSELSDRRVACQLGNVHDVAASH